MNATPAEAGLQPDLRGEPAPGGLEEQTRVALRLPRDRRRMPCTGPEDQRARRGRVERNYTESEPIGILVHEVRVSTVAPDR